MNFISVKLKSWWSRFVRESKIETAVCNFAESHGWTNIKLNGPGSRGKPDRVFFKGPPPRVILIEFKREGEELGPLQKVWRRLFKKMGFEIYTVDDVNYGKSIFNQK